MTDHTEITPPTSRDWIRRPDKAVFGAILLVLVVAVLAPSEVVPTLQFALSAFLSTSGFILFAAVAVGGLKATGAEALLYGAFAGRETRMIFLAAMVGGLAPFCSCEVIPFIAAMLGMGAPLSAIMAFWLSSPLMDPAMFMITAGNLGMPFAIAKTLAAVGIGLLGGFGVRAIARTGVFSNPLRTDGPMASCCTPSSFSDTPKWRFWTEPARLDAFRSTALTNLLFLAKWLWLAYLIEALMIRYIPASWVAGTLGGDGLQPIVLGAVLGGPAYLNGYAAVPLVAGMIEQGMSQGAALAFVLAGGVSCIPAAVAVWALVKPRVFAAYLGFALIGSILAGAIWSAI